MDSNKTNQEIIYIPSCWPADDQDTNYDSPTTGYYEITGIATGGSSNKEPDNE